MKFSIGNELRSNTTKYRYTIIDCYKNSNSEPCYMLKDQWCKYSAPIPVNEKDLLEKYTKIKSKECNEYKEVSETKEKVNNMKLLENEIVYLKCTEEIDFNMQRKAENNLSKCWNTTVRIIPYCLERHATEGVLTCL